MPIATKFIRDFDAIARAGGSEDYDLGLTSLELLGPHAVQMKVLGQATRSSPTPSRNSVILSWSEISSTNTFGLICPCSAFQKYKELCHHAWSALLAFDGSTQPEIVEARKEAEAKTLKLKRLAEAAASDLMTGAIDPSLMLKWPLQKIAPHGVVGFHKVKNAATYTLSNLAFTYGSHLITQESDQKEFVDRVQQQRIPRNLTAEKSLLKVFKGDFTPKKLALKKFSLDELKDLAALLSDSPLQWNIAIDGQRLQFLEVTEASLRQRESHFEFSMRLTADHQTLSLADVIGKTETDSSFIRLDNGSRALLNEDWSKRLEILSRGADLTKEGVLRFSRTSLPLFKSAFEGAKPLDISPEAQSVFDTPSLLNEVGQAEAPHTLKGSLRTYQAEGLFWLLKMSKSGFGGILADDMGLGKTIQIISYFLSRRAHFRTHPDDHRPSLVVVPKSLVSNWKNEVDKFGPALRVLDFAGPNRIIFRPQHFDIVLTTYHVLKNEIERLKLTEFDSIILDEAQAIKNPGSQISAAVFQLQARQRFALSGTPVENSLRDLFSLLHFTNPGLIPRSFDRIYGERKSLSLPKAVTEKIAASIRPFILRRTKKQVLTELPDKSEQVLICDMDGPQRLLYEKTRKYFKMKLKESANETPTGPKATRVFEALLRLRQISCHPALVGEAGTGVLSSKVEMLLEHLEDIKASGNKALVFSQFTSFLDLLKPELEKEKITFEHLDGKTRNRGAVVDRFNSNPDTTVFLISLKAGGTGLNLTPASYVFLMDPWWNPAIESQAIDRAYRMGQKQKVMAYRLIAKGTIEEKIVKLQDQKRHLANALISEDETLASSLSLEDLEFLLEE